MALHQLAASPTTLATVFSPTHSPVLRVDPGDEVDVRSLDVRAYTARFSDDVDRTPRMVSQDVGLTVLGPIEIIGAEPGMAVAVTVLEFRPDDWGWTFASWQHSDLEKALDVGRARPTVVTWEVDTDARVARSPQGLCVPLRPFFGMMGLASLTSDLPLLTPHVAGGNIDCSVLGEGSTLYLPVTAPGGLLYLGDGHAVQGDGEVSGTAVECAVTARVRIDLVAEPLLPGMYAETPTGRVTFGLAPDLNRAARDALADMLTWIEVLHGVDRSTALALASAAVDLRITQIATPAWGVHAVLPPDALSAAPEAHG